MANPSFVVQWYAGALADFPLAVDANHPVFGFCDDGFPYLRLYGGAPQKLQGIPDNFLFTVTVTVPAGGPLAVVIPTPIGSANYRIGFGIRVAADGSITNVGYQNKLAGGFDIVVGDTSQDQVVDVTICRQGAPT